MYLYIYIYTYIYIHIHVCVCVLCLYVIGCFNKCRDIYECLFLWFDMLCHTWGNRTTGNFSGREQRLTAIHLRRQPPKIQPWNPSIFNASWSPQWAPRRQFAEWFRYRPDLGPCSTWHTHMFSFDSFQRFTKSFTVRVFRTLIQWLLFS